MLHVHETACANAAEIALKISPGCAPDMFLILPRPAPLHKPPNLSCILKLGSNLSFPSPALYRQGWSSGERGDAALRQDFSGDAQPLPVAEPL